MNEATIYSTTTPVNLSNSFGPEFKGALDPRRFLSLAPPTAIGCNSNCVQRYSPPSDEIDSERMSTNHHVRVLGM